MFKFNSVTGYLFESIIQRIRLVGVDARNTDRNPDSGRFDHLMMVNFKFMNYARRSLLAGEKVIHFILQPEIQGKILAIPGKTYYRTIRPTHMVILTNCELIMIQEDKVRTEAGKDGGIWTYIPLNKIKKLFSSTRDKNLLTLSIQLLETAPREVPSQVSAKEDVDQLLASYEGLITDKKITLPKHFYQPFSACLLRHHYHLLHLAELLDQAVHILHFHARANGDASSV